MVSSDRAFHCPFCGNQGKRTAEHVWARWMRSTPGARQLLVGATGRRLKVATQDLDLGVDGKYQLVDGESVPVAELLPHVTVDVCLTCNTGWMKRLEDAVKHLLAPWTKVGWPVNLDRGSQVLLSAWATKSWMAYALSQRKDTGPFSDAERRAMAAGPAPFDRSRVWTMQSDAPTAYVGMGLLPTLITPDGEVPDLTSAPNNAGFGYLAYNGLVFFAAVAPAADSPLLDLIEELVDDVGFAKRIWPPSGEEFFPTRCAPAPAMSELLGIAGSFERYAALPVVGLSASEVQEVRSTYAAGGADVLQIRARWQPNELAQLDRWRIENDPDGYGMTWQPYKTLGGIEWHGGRYQAALDHYRRAQQYGATMQDIGSQLCDTLMHLGAYAEAQVISNQLMSDGANEWGDVFREAILHELVNELRLEEQERLPREQGEVTIRVSRKSARRAWRHIRKQDALDSISWAVLGQRIRRRTRFTSIMASAYFGLSVSAWLALSMHAATCPHDAQDVHAIGDGLAEFPDIAATLIELLDVRGEEGELHSAALRFVRTVASR